MTIENENKDKDVSYDDVKHFLKIKMRIKRHGADIVKKSGRPRKSIEEKKETLKRWRDKKRQEKIDAGWTPKTRGKAKKKSDKKQVSDEQKKLKRRLQYLEKKKKDIEAGILPKPRGRPRKIIQI